MSDEKSDEDIASDAISSLTLDQAKEAYLILRWWLRDDICPNCGDLTRGLCYCMHDG